MALTKLIKRKIRRNYIAALSIIAFLICTSGVFVQILIDVAEDDAVTINLSGMQRMLTQKIALHVNQLEQENLPYSDAGKISISLHRALSTLESNHQYLTQNEARMDSLSDIQRQNYFGGSPSLDQQLSDYISAGRAIYGAEDTADHTQFELTNTNQLLEKLDLIVKQFETEAEQKLHTLSVIEIALLSIMLCVLLFEALFIFRPMENLILRSLIKFQGAKARAIQARREAEGVNKFKSQFISNMSHELRTPVSNVFGILDMMELEPSSKKRKDFIGKAKQNAQNLLYLINDILEISKLEARKLEPINNDFDLIKALDECLAIVSMQSQTKGLSFTYHAASKLPKWVRGDEEKLKRVFSTILKNAYQYTPKGSISVFVQLDEDESGYQIKLRVSDTGVGIPEDKLNAIYDAFSQSDMSDTRQFGGAGLGLNITKQILDMLGGEIKVRSTVNKGSIFTLELPLLRSSYKAEDKSQVSQPKRLHTYHIAVIDDLDTSREFISAIIEENGGRTTKFASATEMMKMLTAAGDFDAIVTDMHMPGVSGLELSELLHAVLGPNTPPVVLITASTETLTNKVLEVSQISQVLQKPVHHIKIVDTLYNTINKEHDGESKRYNILLAEDDATNAEIYEYFLVDKGHSVTIARDGKEAVERTKVHTYDVIFMDINMPIMDGITACEIIQNELNITTPIISLTANIDLYGMLEHREAKFYQQLVKPVSARELYDTLDNMQLEQNNKASQYKQFNG